jgi:hypothetical protein
MGCDRPCHQCTSQWIGIGMLTHRPTRKLTCYLKASGVLTLLRKKPPNQRVKPTGHGAAKNR